MSGQRSVHVLVGGLVQGVGFRWYTLQRADALGLSGWVRNLPGGDVELFAQGDDSAVEELVEWLREGPGFALVRRLQVREAPRRPGLSGFAVR
ncbi:acylphosphatase [uncultured Propionibacterium sp.]|uniref:acylphosphatase n=1 Tax=uncultured Propionibacterium sp. TaxID=218066 RepID=UPI00292CFC7C|nr:acylphosphatase [uncultured Propionibacterium sp.]